MQPVQDLNQVFSAVHPQIRVNLRGCTYSRSTMHIHLINYCNENYKQLAQDLKGTLKTCQLDLAGYLYKIENTMTSGLEVTLLISSRMYKCGIMVIRSDFVWLSHSIKPELCPIVIVQNAMGQFMGTQVKKPLYVSEVGELVACVRSKKPIVMSIPQRDGSIGNFGPKSQVEFLPIAEVTTTDTSTEVLHKNVADFEQKHDIDDSDSTDGDDSDSEEDDKNEDDEESEDGSENDDDSGKNSENSKSEEEFEPGSDDDEYESESTDLLANNVGVTEPTVNTDNQKYGTEKQSVHLRIEDIDFTDSSTHKEYNNSKTTEDLSAMVDVTITNTNTENEMLVSGGNFVARNPE